ncbi:hypothetical protein CHARACLAT_027325 [Characodon lateralis]|uniref:Uncharacterized protein n=1 Tax=Characodon lateralis TaxID=208331 RepID=A0ABU7E403_9TELE|nr:hypothetical protein [Characodon lateralis]
MKLEMRELVMQDIRASAAVLDVGSPAPVDMDNETTVADKDLEAAAAADEGVEAALCCKQLRDAGKV